MIRGTLASAAFALVACAALAATSASAQVEHWGSYGNGGALVGSPTPVPNLEDVVEVDASNNSSLALEANGTVWAWGENVRGQLGDGLTEASLTEAVQVQFPAGVKIVSIGEAQNAGYAIDSTGQGWSWGLVSPALCLGSGAEETLTPQMVPGITSASDVQGAAKHVLWLMKNGTVETCGTNGNGQLGIGGQVTNSSRPVLVPILNVAQISAGQKESCARTSEGAVYDWGSDLNGQIGNGVEEEEVNVPFRVPLAGPASEVSCGGDLPENGHTLALVRGALYAWGADATGQLGDGRRVNKPTPTLATATAPLSFVQVTASGAYSLGLTAAGTVYGWGSNAYKALNGSSQRFSLTPEAIFTGGVSEISSTAYNSVVR